MSNPTPPPQPPQQFSKEFEEYAALVESRGTAQHYLDEVGPDGVRKMIAVERQRAAERVSSRFSSPQDQARARARLEAADRARDSLSPEEQQRIRDEVFATLEKVKETPATAPVTEHAIDHAAESKKRTRQNWIKGAVRPDWKPRRRGDANRDIYPKGGFNLMIGVIDNEVRAAMTKTVLLAYLACLEEADLDGQFEMPAGDLGERIGCNRRNAQDAIYTLRDTRTIKVIHEGGPKTPNVYTLIPAREFDKAHALKVLELARQATRAEVTKNIGKSVERKAKASATGPA